LNNIKMEINIISTFFESNLYLFLFIIPFLSQLWIPLWAMFFLLFAGSITNSLTELFILFLIVLIWVIIWDSLSYFFGKKLFKLKFFQFFLKKEKIKKIYIKTTKIFNTKWAISIFISRFLITGVWPMLNYIAWFQSFNFKKFGLYIILWEVLYVFEFLILWYLFKNTIDDILGIISNLWLILFLLLVLYIIWIHLFKKKKKLVNW
jgi:membrane protein DedA with SNARE-associated domain